MTRVSKSETHGISRTRTTLLDVVLDVNGGFSTSLGLYKNDPEEKYTRSAVPSHGQHADYVLVKPALGLTSPALGTMKVFGALL